MGLFSNSREPNQFSLFQPQCTNARQNRWQMLHHGELEETTRTPSYYVDEDYLSALEIQ